MTMQETSRILAMITAIYPSFQKDRNPKLLAEIWQRVFADTPYAAVEQAVSAFIATDTKGFPPTPGAINAFLIKAIELEEPTENEAWARVLKAISRGIYNSREEFDKLSPELQRIVGSPKMLYEWALLDTNEVHTVIASGFKRSYRARQELRRSLNHYSLLAGTQAEDKFLYGRST